MVVVVEGRLSVGRVAIAGGGAGHPWNVREAAGGRAGQRGTAAVQEELAVVDDARSWNTRKGCHGNGTLVKRAKGDKTVAGGGSDGSLKF